MSYFPNNVGFQVPSLVGQSANSFPDQFYYPFESHQLHQLPDTDLQEFTLTKNYETVEQVPSQPRSRAHSAQTKGQGGKKLKGNANKNKNKQKADETTRQKAENNNPTKDYIHVRARRGQATDSHSLAERVRREKISERMQMLQDLVPGCDKITGKAFKLDQIITYIQSLQTQVQYLSMKLASVRLVYDNEMHQDQTKEQETNFKKDDSPTQLIMAGTNFTEHQLESSNLLRRVQSLFSQDGSDNILPWDADDKTLIQNFIDFDSFEQNSAHCNLF